MLLQAACVLEAKAVLGEGPLWDQRAQCLWWVDIQQARVHRFDPKTGQDLQYPVREPVGAVALRGHGGLVMALERRFALLDADSHAIETAAEVDIGQAERFNDGKCDPEGRFLAGTLSEEEGAAALYCLHVDHSVTRLLEGVTVSNGLAWSADGAMLYYIDSPLREIHAFDYEAEGPALSNRRRVVAVPEGQGTPDGMTIDADGNLWTAMWGGHAVICWNPATGKELHRVEVPVANVTSCTFGGRDLDELYITTASEGLDAAARAEQPMAGCIFRARPEATGVPAAYFAG